MTSALAASTLAGGVPNAGALAASTGAAATTGDAASGSCATCKLNVGTGEPVHEEDRAGEIMATEGPKMDTFG